MKKQSNPFEAFWKKWDKNAQRYIGSKEGFMVHGLHYADFSKMEKEFFELCENQAKKTDIALKKMENKKWDKIRYSFGSESGQGYAFRLVAPTVKK